MTIFAPSVGSQVIVAYGLEVTPGVAVPATDYIRVEEMPTLRWDPKRQNLETAGGSLIAGQEMVELDGSVKGDVILPVRGDAGWKLLATLMVDAVTGSAAPYTHTLTPRAPKTFTLYIQRGGNCLSYAGCTPEKLVLILNHTTPFKGTLSVTELGIPTPAALLTPVFTVDQVFTFSHLQPMLLLGNGATSQKDVDDIEVTITFGNVDRYGAGGAGLPTTIVPGIESVDWKFSRLFRDDVEQALFLTRMMAPGIIQAQLVNGTKQLTLKSGAAYYDMQSHKAAVKDAITEDYQCKTLPDASGNLIGLTLINSVATAYSS